MATRSLYLGAQPIVARLGIERDQADTTQIRQLCRQGRQVLSISANIGVALDAHPSPY